MKALEIRDVTTYRSHIPVRPQTQLVVVRPRGETGVPGCGRGEMLEFLKENGIPVKGIDGDAESVAISRKAAC